jgi:hypothetical protein
VEGGGRWSALGTRAPFSCSQPYTITNDLTGIPPPAFFPPPQSPLRTQGLPSGKQAREIGLCTASEG